MVKKSNPLPPDVFNAVIDPLIFAKILWPSITFYRQQREIIYSVRDTPETFVVAGNMLGGAPPSLLPD
jgi:hypothetical protein